MSLTDDQIVAKNFKKYHEAILPYLNGSAHSGFTPIGTVISVMGTTAPLNYLACDGTIYNISDYPELAAYFNQQFGSSNFFGGNGTTTFAVPDLRGEFLRGTGTNSHANQGSGAAVGVHQDGTEIGESFSDMQYNVISVSGYKQKNVDKRIKQSNDEAGRLIINTSDKDEWGYYYTSRPTNTSVLYCIASKNIFMDAGSNYSTEEQVVGTWIDGKPIYQKTVDCGAMPNNATKSVNHNIQNIDYVVNLFGVAYRPTDGMVNTLPCYNHNIYGAELVSNPTSILVTTFADRSAFSESYVTIQYTKTTDA